MQNNIRSVGKGNAFGFTKWNRPQKLKYVRSVKQLSNQKNSADSAERPEPRERIEPFDLFPSTNSTQFSEMYQDDRTTVTIIHGNRERRQNGVSGEPKYFQIFESPDGKTIPLSMQPPQRITTAPAVSGLNSIGSSIGSSIVLGNALKNNSNSSRGSTVSIDSTDNIGSSDSTGSKRFADSEISDSDLQFVNYQAQRYIVSIPRHQNLSQSVPSASTVTADQTILSEEMPKKSARLSRITPQQRVEFAKKRLAECSRLALRPK